MKNRAIGALRKLMGGPITESEVRQFPQGAGALRELMSRSSVPIDESRMDNAYRQVDNGVAPEYAAAEAKGLDLSQEARIQRATEQGYTIPAMYRGENGMDIQELLSQLRANPDHDTSLFLERDPSIMKHTMNEGAEYPLYVNNQDSIPLTGEEFNANGLTDQASVIGRNHAMIRNPDYVRSRNAVFDPDNKGLGRMLGAGLPGALTLYGLNDRER